MQRVGMLSIWFFIGLLLLAYGILIFATGLAEWSSPPPVVRADLHAAVWWGLLLIALGAFYTFRFSPKRGSR
jgi:FtsH-binding integral membrane protein